jgi:16S rRNA A1518/A1519 N6-dimethyltransferase RsmA/KsgA/DIM1 with predicted DNA glycosylase/AP lyase activity
MGIGVETVGVIDPRPGDVIVEVGAGRGVLTARLAECAERVIALEKDQRLIPELPKVRSALLVLNRRGAPRLPGAADEPFRAFLRAAFAERRKMLWKNLVAPGEPDAIAEAYDSLGVARNARAEELAPDLLFALFALFRHLRS